MKRLRTFSISNSVMIRAPRARVFHALTDAAALASWWPKSAVSEPKRGGLLVFHWFGGSRIETRFGKFVRDVAVDFAFAHERVAFRLAPKGGFVSVRVTHSRVRWSADNIPEIVHIAQSWTFLLLNLKCVLESRKDLRQSR
ncbi:MAG: hypothetical protein FD180_1057 [Planctomycetota bacterium]|nr:MAG: hypothetical protein FD180_1057 [Planctomycetota bacterium]